jgi:hypothetical protein
MSWSTRAPLTIVSFIAKATTVGGSYDELKRRR